MSEEKYWFESILAEEPTPSPAPAEDLSPVAEDSSVSSQPVEQADLSAPEAEEVPSSETSDRPDPLAELFSEDVPLRHRAVPPEEVVQKPAKKKPASAVSPFVEFAEVLVGALVAAILVLTLICRTGVVDGSSMVPTMHHGDRYLISDLFYTPEQGDIVVFRPEVGGENELWIKRVIAVEGQTVYIDPNDYKVYVDGKPLSEPYLDGSATIPHSTENPITVPEGSVYVLGDNRAISHDSRYKDLGCVPVGHLAGRVILRFWPLSDFGFCE